MILTEKDINTAIDLINFYKKYISGQIDGKMVGFNEHVICFCIKKLSKIYNTKFITKEE